jgi:radical SAM protein with 4Fe4S-binding SPASM domain
MQGREKIKADPEIVFRQEGDTGILFNPSTGAVNVLNSSGKFIWPLLDGKHSKEEILREMVPVFDISDHKKLGEDYDNFTGSLRNFGVLEGCINKPSALTGVCLGITSKCNLSCKHCLNRNIPVSEPDMTLEQLLDLIDQLATGGVKDVNLFGGEPLMNPEFKRIVEYLNQYPITLSLNTNATLVDREMARWLKEHKIGGAVVSFDGSQASVMDAIRGKGAFDRCLKGIAALQQEGISVLLSATLNKINYQDVKGMVLLGKKLGSNSIRFNHVFFSGNATCFIKEIYLSPGQEKQAIKAVWQASQEFGSFIYGSSSYLCQKQKLEELKNHPPSTSDKLLISPCGAADGKCAIRPDGWVVPCEIIWEVKCGNIKEKPLKEIWQDSEVMGSFRKSMEVDLNEIPECKGCRYQYLCFIGHRCYPYYYPGGIKNKSLYCWLK